MTNYFWRVVMHDGNLNDQTLVAMFLLETDARNWAASENKDSEENYSVLPPRKSLP